MKIPLSIINPYTLQRHKYPDSRAELKDGTPVIYFLFFNGKIVYVGVSDNRLPGRLRSHKRGEDTTFKKKFDEVAYVEEHSARNRYAKEIFYIFKHKPKYNYREWGKYWSDN
jgi:predicted GIY-YIG superfamily endonuclease